jgi:hypothetical protein
MLKHLPQFAAQVISLPGDPTKECFTIVFVSLFLIMSKQPNEGFGFVVTLKFSRVADSLPEVIDPNITIVKLAEIGLQESRMFSKRSDIRLPALCKQLDCIS